MVLKRKVAGDDEHMRVHLERRKGWTAKVSKGGNAEDSGGEVVSHGGRPNFWDGPR